MFTLTLGDILWGDKKQVEIMLSLLEESGDTLYLPQTGCEGKTIVYF